MKIVTILILLVFCSSPAFAGEQSDREILDLFKPTPVCTDYGVTYGFSFSNLDGYVGSSGNLVRVIQTRKTKDRPYPKNDCISLPKGYVADLVEKDECYAYVVIHPESLSDEQAKYLASRIHKPPFGLSPLVKSNFKTQNIPFKKFRAEWVELEKLRTSADTKKVFEKDWDSPMAKSIAENYRRDFKSLSEKTLASFQLKRSDLEIVKYGYMGCH